MAIVKKVKVVGALIPKHKIFLKNSYKRDKKMSNVLLLGRKI